MANLPNFAKDRAPLMLARTPRTDGDLRTLLEVGALGNLDDAALLDLFEANPGATAAHRAFEVLVERHGGLVLRVARGRLAAEADARDAFQATFWLLARRSRSIRHRDALAGWLFGVASRVAARANVEAARRRTRERRAAAPLADSTSDPARSEPDLLPTIEAEIHHLPAPYRVAVILADLEGLTTAEAAARLGCPVGTFKARLSRARARLRTRLIHRGVAPAHWQPTAPRPLVVPIPLIQAACRLALSSTPSAGPPAVVGSIVALAQGGSRPMFFASISTWAAFASAALVAGAVAVTAVINEEAGPDPSQVMAEPAPSATPQPIAARSEPSPVIDPPPIPGPVEPRDEPSPLLEPVVRQVLGVTESIADPDARATMLLGLGRLQTRQGDRSGARATLGKALEAADAMKPKPDGSFPRVVYEIGEAQAQNGDGEIARKTFDHAIPLIQNLPPDQQDKHWLLLLDFEQRTGNRSSSRATTAAYLLFILVAKEDHHLQSRFVLSGGRFLYGMGFYPAARLVAIRAIEGDFIGAFHDVETGREFFTAKLPEPRYRPLIRPRETRYQAMIGIAQALRPEDGPLIPKTLEKVRAVLLEAEPLSSSSQYILALMDVETRLGRYAEALALATSVAGLPTPQDWTFRGLAHALIAVAIAQEATGDRLGAGRTVREATILARTMNERVNRDDLIIQIAALTARVGDLGTAFDLAESLEIWPRYLALEKILHDRQAANDQVGTRRTRERMVVVVKRALLEREGENGPSAHHGRGSRFGWLARLAAASGDPADFEAARQFLGELSTHDQQRSFLDFLASAEARAGRFEEALKTANQVRDPRTRGLALLKLVEIELDREKPSTMEDLNHHSVIFLPEK